jgi:hypothetical protein
MNLKRSKFELVEQANNTHRLFVLDGGLAIRVNRVLKSYPSGALKRDSEGIFTVPENSWTKIAKILGIKNS